MASIDACAELNEARLPSYLRGLGVHFWRRLIVGKMADNRLDTDVSMRMDAPEIREWIESFDSLVESKRSESGFAVPERLRAERELSITSEVF